MIRSGSTQRDYLLSREQHARQMAENAADALTRNIHNDLANRYAERAQACDMPVERETRSQVGA